jgi:hypothetical protein
VTGLLDKVDLPAPVGDRWFEDYAPGSAYEFGYASLSETEIVEFARQYDPQSIHTDPAWSTTGPFGGLIASGVHTVAVCMRLYVDHYISHVASLASPVSTRSAGRDRCDPVIDCASASRTSARVRRAPSLTAGSCTRP